MITAIRGKKVAIVSLYLLEDDNGFDESSNMRYSGKKESGKVLSGSNAKGKNNAGLRNSNDDLSSNNFDEEFEDETKNEKQLAQNKQVPPPRGNSSISKERKPNFAQLKEAKQSGFKQSSLNDDIKLKGGIKPNLSTHNINQKKSNYASGYRISGTKGSASRPNLTVYTGNATSRNMKESSLGRSIWDPYDKRPRHEQILDMAHLFIADSYHRTLEEMFQHNTLGTQLLKDINELLNHIIERHKPALVSGKLMPSLGESMTGVDSKKEQLIFESEYKSGEKLLNNLNHELQTVIGILESSSDPL